MNLGFSAPRISNRFTLAAIVVLLLFLVGCGGGLTISVRGPLTRGPYPDAEGGAGDAPDDLVVDKNPKTIYASGQQCGVFKSTDGGAHWRLVFRKKNPSTIFDTCAYSIAIGPSATLYLTTSSGVFKSTDHGRSWHKLGLDNLSLFVIAVDPQNPRTVYIGTDRGLYKTTNDGGGWQRIGLERQGVDALAVAPGARVVYAGNLSGNKSSPPYVFVSTDGGRSWQAAGPDHHPSDGRGQTLPIPFIDNDALALVPKSSTAIYAIRGGDAIRNGGLFRSTNAGASWSGIGPSDHVTALALDPKRPGVIYAGTSRGIFMSADRGRSWRHVGPKRNVAALGIAANGHVLYVGTWTGAVLQLRLRG
jgi:BNR/Asp-box repeat